MSLTTGRQATHQKQVRTSYMSHLSPDSIITGVVGLVVLLFGLIAIVRAGLGGPIAEPVVRVLGFNHTATLGLIEIGIGLCLLASASASSRAGEMLFGAVLGIAGFVGAVQVDSFKETLALESSMAWIAAIAGLVIVSAVLVLPRFGRKTTSFTQGSEDMTDSGSWKQ